MVFKMLVGFICTVMAMVTVALVPLAGAMPIQSEVIKKQVHMTMVLGNNEMDQCAANMVRKAMTLTFTCELSIPLKAKNAKLQGIASPKSLMAFFGGAQREVQVEVSPDAKVLSLTTTFDVTGLDLELSKFNDDFYAVYAQAAHTVISDALRKQPIKMEVLETRK